MSRGRRIRSVPCGPPGESNPVYRDPTSPGTIAGARAPLAPPVGRPAGKGVPLLAASFALKVAVRVKRHEDSARGECLGETRAPIIPPEVAVEDADALCSERP